LSIDSPFFCGWLSKIRDVTKLHISTLVISDLDRFVEIKDFWDKELREHVDDPYLFSCLLIEHWKIGRELGWTPFLMVFMVKNRLVGFAPLMMRSNFGFRQVSTFDQYTYPYFFSDNYRKNCVDIMITFLFKRLKCESASIICEDESPNQKVLKRVCGNKGFRCTGYPQEGEAVIPVNQSLNSFNQSLKKKNSKKFAKIRRKLDELGSWQILCSELNCDSLTKIRAIERFSWKAGLEGKKKAMKDLDLECTLKALQNTHEYAAFFEPQIWTLELNGMPLSYMLAIKRNQSVFFAKTSYDSRYKHLSPGLFLINELIERIFRCMTAEKIDFMTDLPFVQVWNPLIKKRRTFKILRNQFLSRVCRLLFENPVSLKVLQGMERVRWQKKQY
jgi:hypothetical protein